MRVSRTIRAWGALTAMLFWAASGSRAQDSSGSLGDLARKTRKEKSAATHIRATHVADGEDDGPDSGGVWRLHPCATQVLCYELSIMLPKSMKWSRTAEEPKPVVIPIPGHEDEPDRAIRVYKADPLVPMQSVDVAKRTFLQSWFARTEYFGQAAHLDLDEHPWVDNNQVTITHFTVNGSLHKYYGLSIVTWWSAGNFGFACAYREEDASTAASICDAIVRSAHYQILQPAKTPVLADPNDQENDPDDGLPNEDTE